MIKDELEYRLKKAGVPNDCYCLKGGFPIESYVLAKSNIGWEVYYSEKGLKSGKKSFITEDDACAYLYNLVIKYVK